MTLDEAARIAERHRKLEQQRNEAIRRARAEGHSLRAIAAAVGLSPQAVSNIVNR